MSTWRVLVVVEVAVEQFFLGIAQVVPIVLFVAICMFLEPSASRLAVVYTGPCVVSLPAPPRPGAPGVVVTRQAGPITVVSPTAAPAPAPAALPPPAPSPAPEAMPVAPTSPAPAPGASGGGAVTISAPVPAGPLPPPRHVR